MLYGFRLAVLEENLGVYGIHVHQNNRTLAEHRFRSNDRENLCSASKMVVAIGVGIAIEEKLLTLEEKILDAFDEYRQIASPGSEDICVEDLLLMASGHKTEDFSKYNLMDRAALFFSSPVLDKPGEKFYYEDLCSYMLGRLIEKKSGQNFLSYMKTRFFDKLKIINPQWHTCQEGHTSCSGGLYLTTEEFSRVGICLLNKGMYEGQRVLDASFVDKMTAKWMDTSFKMDSETRQGYGYQVWKCTIPNAYRASGMYGQFCIILEDYQAVITVTSHNEGETYDILRAVWREVLPLLDK